MMPDAHFSAPTDWRNAMKALLAGIGKPWSVPGFWSRFLFADAVPPAPTFELTSKIK